MSEIHRVASRSDPFSLRALLEAGADPNERQPSSGETPLMCAAAKRRRVNIKVLISFGADLTLGDFRGRTVLRHAVELEIVRLLLELGADPDADQVQGKTMAALWAEAGHFKLARLLVEFGADQEALGRNGRTVRELLAGPNKVADAFAAMADAQRDEAHVAKHDAYVRKESDGLRISPEEYVSRHRHIFVWSLHTCMYSDPNLQAWAQEVFDLLGDVDAREQIYRKYLGDAELAKALKSLDKERARIARDDQTKKLDSEYEEMYYRTE